MDKIKENKYFENNTTNRFRSLSLSLKLALTNSRTSLKNLKSRNLINSTLYGYGRLCWLLAVLLLLLLLLRVGTSSAVLMPARLLTLTALVDGGVFAGMLPVAQRPCAPLPFAVDFAVL